MRDIIPRFIFSLNDATISQIMSPESVGSLILRSQHERGLRREEMVSRALGILEKEGKIDYFERSAKLDGCGIDFLVTKGRKRSKFSVKSSRAGVEREKLIHPERYRHDDIIFVIPKAGQDLGELADDIMAKMEEKVENQRSKHGW